MPHLRQFEFWYAPDGSLRALDIQFYDLNNTSLPLETKTNYLPYRIYMQFRNGVIDFRTVNKAGEKQYVHIALRMDFFGGWNPIPFYLDVDGKIDSIHAMGSPWNFIVHKRAPIDIEQYTKRFAKKPVIGGSSPWEQFSKEVAGT